MQIQKKIAFIGGGNMASAMLRTLVDKRIFLAENIIVYDIDIEKTKVLSTELGIQVAMNNREAAAIADFIILAVKPIYVPTVLKEISETLSMDKILISIAAGISKASILDYIGGRCPVIRTMPNTPALVGEGMTAIVRSDEISMEDFERIQTIFKSFGKVEIVEERLMDAVTAMSGSSPAYVFLFIEAMADGGVWMGLPRDVSYRLAAQAVLGSAKMVLESGMHPGVLKDMVSSPGGTTIEALHILEKYGLRSMMMEAVQACTEKSIKLGKES